MAYTITRLQMENRARRKTDTVGDANVIDDELHDECNDLISMAWKTVMVEDPDRIVAMTTISTTAGTQTYTLPADFMGLRRVDAVDGDQRTMIEPAPLLELDMSDLSSGNEWGLRYRLIGGGQTGSTERLHLRPDPGTRTYEVWYTTAAPVLSTDGAALDCRFDEHRFVIAGLARWISVRQGLPDIAAHEAEMIAAQEHIRVMAKRRDAGRAKQITDVRSQRSSVRRYPRP